MAKSFRLVTALSNREVEILEEASDGRSTKEIAGLLGLSNNGVKFHLKNIHAKLGARRRTEAVRIACEHGLISPSWHEMAKSFRQITTLSNREVEILEQTSDGRSIREIAGLIGLRDGGVKFHLKNIYAKLSARRRTEAVRIAREHGLISRNRREEAFVSVVVPTRRLSLKSAKMRADALHCPQVRRPGPRADRGIVYLRDAVSP